MMRRCARRFFLLFLDFRLWLFRFYYGLKRWPAKEEAVDLALVGIVKHADGIGRIPIGIIELLHQDLKISCLPTRYSTLRNLGQEVRKTFAFRRQCTNRVSLLSEQLAMVGSSPYKLLPPAAIRLSYSMIESTRIPSSWVTILNTHFDAVVVPDLCLIEVYQNSGVKIPIFELPLGIESLKTSASFGIPFVFGTTVSCDHRKNIPLLIQAFSEEFGADEQVILRINSRFGERQKCQELIGSLNAKNIIFTSNVLNKQHYADLMGSFHCFVNISKGEGFSLCPREALTLGIPCILSSQTAQKTLCETGFVRAVPCPVEQPAFETIYGQEQLGHFYSCHIEDVRVALRDVYTHYSEYLEKAAKGKEWVRRYSWESLKNRYLNLIRPKSLLLGDQNSITEEYLMTNSSAFYEKYQNLQ